MDFGPEGLVECLRILAAEGIPQVGGGADLATARRPLVLERHGIKVAIVAANGFQAAKSAATETTPGVAPLDEAALLADIAAAGKTVDVHRGAPIVYSLGNFAFDYYPVDPPEWTGWVARLTFTKGRPVEFETHAVVLDAAGLPRPAREDD